MITTTNNNKIIERGDCMNTQKPHNLEEMLLHLSQVEIKPISQEEIIQKILETMPELFESHFNEEKLREVIKQAVTE